MRVEKKWQTESIRGRERRRLKENKGNQIEDREEGEICIESDNKGEKRGRPIRNWKKM